MRAIVLKFDHLPLSYLGCYGNTWIETPNLDRLAAQSVVFDGCYSADVSETTRIPAWWSGQSASAAEAGCCTHLMDLLRSAGVCTTLCIERGSRTQYSAVFDEIRDIDGSDDADAPARERPFAKLVADAVDCWQRQSPGTERSVLWVASRGIPSPWLPPAEIAGIYWEEFFDAESLRLVLAAATGNESLAVDTTIDPEQSLTEALPGLVETGLLKRGVVPELEEYQALNRAVHAAYVSAIDAWCGTLLDAISATSPDDLLLIVAAASGDLLTPHPCVERGCPPIVDAVVRVPLIVRIGAGEPVGSRRDGLVSTADIPATLAAWLQLPEHTPPGDSRSLLPMIRCEADPVRDSVLFGAEGIGRGLRTGEYSCLCAVEHGAGGAPPRLGRPWLFSKPDDAGDFLDVADQNPAVAESLAERISAVTGIAVEQAPDPLPARVT
jgi:arylsulfatase A-like enzyme